MRRISIVTIALLLVSSAAFADSFRSSRHLVKIDVQPLSGTSRQYDVQVFDAASKLDVARLNVITNGNAPADSETTANGTRYSARIVPHGDSYLIEFKADDGVEVDSMRGGFTMSRPSTQALARVQVLRGGRDIAEAAVLRRVEPVSHVAGTVVVDVLIDKSGFVKNATAVSTTDEALSAAAVEAVKQWQFAPTLQGAMPTEVLQEVTIDVQP
ncbi:MAG TPA: TonB family protein [Thermoanaerobaculia bacterium]